MVSQADSKQCSGCVDPVECHKEAMPWRGFCYLQGKQAFWHVYECTSVHTWECTCVPVRMCMCTYVLIYTYVLVCESVYRCEHAHVSIYVCVSVYTCMCAYITVCMHVHMCIESVCACVMVCICMRVCMCIHEGCMYGVHAYLKVCILVSMNMYGCVINVCVHECLCVCICMCVHITAWMWYTCVYESVPMWWSVCVWPWEDVKYTFGWMYLYVYTYICTWVCLLYVKVHYLCPYMNVCICLKMQACWYVNTRMYMYTCIYMCENVFARV